MADQTFVEMQDQITRHRVAQQYARVRYENRVNLISGLIGYAGISILAVVLMIVYG